MTQHWPDELWANENPAMVPSTPDEGSGPQNGAESFDPDNVHDHCYQEDDE